MNLNIPNLGVASPVHRGTHRGEGARTLRSEVASVNLRSEGHLSWRTVQPGPDGSCGLGQGHAGPTMQVPQWLLVPDIDLHPHHHPLGLHLHVLYAQVLIQPLLLLQGVQIDLFHKSRGNESICLSPQDNHRSLLSMHNSDVIYEFFATSTTVF